MDIIPVIDLKGGVVVHARMGRRNDYRAIETPLARTSAPVDVVRGLLTVYPFRAFYIADLDAIERQGSNDAVISTLHDAFGGIDFWIDNGIADSAQAARWLANGLGRLVLGSESQQDHRSVRHFANDPRIVLSLDFRSDAFAGPVELLDRPDAWPQSVIVMTLARVGSASGPDFPRLADIKTRATSRAIYAAGGVRDADDLSALARGGIAGALVATAIHNGRLTGAQIARLQAPHGVQSSG